jgi:hypothetical protein
MSSTVLSNQYALNFIAKAGRAEEYPFMSDIEGLEPLDTSRMTVEGIKTFAAGKKLEPDPKCKNY